MTILAIDSSGLVASTALYIDGQIRAEYSVNFKKTHSETLLPMIDEIMSMTKTEKSELSAIAIAAGPGSFTGLRIGSATAKGLGLALSIPLIPVPTLEGLAYQAMEANGVICPMMDARRAQVYTAMYQFLDGCTCKREACVIPVEELISSLPADAENIVFLGDGVDVYADQLKSQVKQPFQIAPVHHRYQSAAAVALSAARRYEEGKIVSAAEFAPEYLRLSQAERERKERLKNGQNN